MCSRDVDVSKSAFYSMNAPKTIRISSTKQGETTRNKRGYFSSHTKMGLFYYADNQVITIFLMKLASNSIDSSNCFDLFAIFKA